MIPLTDCKHRYAYRIRSRNLVIGVFNSVDAGFIGIREKFGQKYLFTEYHWDTGAPHGTVHPQVELCYLPVHIDLNEHLHDKTHKTDLWWNGEPIIRRDTEIPHGGRHGFEDIIARTGERMPDDQFPHLRENKELFLWLMKLEEDTYDRFNS